MDFLAAACEERRGRNEIECGGLQRGVGVQPRGAEIESHQGALVCILRGMRGNRCRSTVIGRGSSLTDRYVSGRRHGSLFVREERRRRADQQPREKPPEHYPGIISQWFERRLHRSSFSSALAAGAGWRGMRVNSDSNARRSSRKTRTRHAPLRFLCVIYVPPTGSTVRTEESPRLFISSVGIPSGRTLLASAIKCGAGGAC